MTTRGFAVSHARDAEFVQGLRAYFKYRDLGVADATDGRVMAHIIRANGTEVVSQPHYHDTEFQLIYVLKGWIEFEYEAHGTVRLEAGSCVHQPPKIRHREISHSEDAEMLKLVMPADFGTVTVERI